MTKVTSPISKDADKIATMRRRIFEKRRALYPSAKVKSQYFFLNTPWMHTAMRFKTIYELVEWSNDFEPLYDLINKDVDRLSLEEAKAARDMWEDLTNIYGKFKPFGKMPIHVNRLMRRMLAHHKLDLPSVCEDNEE